MEFGRLLKELRGDLSLREAAKKIGIAHSYIDGIEKGTMHPSERVVEALFKVFPLYKNKLAKAYVACKIPAFILDEMENQELDKILVILEMLEVEEQKIILKSILEKVAFSPIKKEISTK